MLTLLVDSSLVSLISKLFFFFGLETNEVLPKIMLLCGLCYGGFLEELSIT